MDNETKQLISEGKKVMYRKVDGVPYRLVVRQECGDTLIKQREVPVMNGQPGKIRMVGSFSDDLQEDIRHALDNCYCDAVTHCDFCTGHGMRNLHRHLNNRSDAVAESRRKRMSIVQ